MLLPLLTCPNLRLQQHNELCGTLSSLLGSVLANTAPDGPRPESVSFLCARQQRLRDTTDAILERAKALLEMYVEVNDAGPRTEKMLADAPDVHGAKEKMSELLDVGKKVTEAQVEALVAEKGTEKDDVGKGKLIDGSCLVWKGFVKVEKEQDEDEDQTDEEEGTWGNEVTRLRKGMDKLVKEVLGA